MMSHKNFIKILILSLAFAGCSNAIPSVESLGSQSKTTPVAPKDAHRFSQLNAGSFKSQTTDTNYMGVLRVGQSQGQIRAASSDGYSLRGTVTLQK